MRSRILKFSLVAGTVFVIGGGFWCADSACTKAVDSSAKQATLTKGQHPYGLAAKGGGQLEVTLSSDVPSPIPASRLFRLAGLVTASMALEDLRYEWILPEGVAVRSGNLTGTLGPLAEGASIET
ncbi:MAG: hypothetical protein AAB250_06325, partial [Bdellovibrionota bacterium]